jgi:hypothetical protein
MTPSLKRNRKDYVVPEPNMSFGQLHREIQKLLDEKATDKEIIEELHLTLHNYRVWFQKHNVELINKGIYKAPKDLVKNKLSTF